LKTLPCERTLTGAVVTDYALRVKGVANIWAVGDCAQVPNACCDGKPCPPTAQHALRQGKTVAENIVATLAGKPVHPFRFRPVATLPALGRHTAVAEVWGLNVSGVPAWLLWRAMHLSQLPGLQKKVRVAADWILDLIFPRDIASTVTVAKTSPARVAS